MLSGAVRKPKGGREGRTDGQMDLGAGTVQTGLGRLNFVLGDMDRFTENPNSLAVGRLGASGQGDVGVC